MSNGLKSPGYYLELLNQFQEKGDFASLSTIDLESTVTYGYMSMLYGKLEAEKERYIDNYQRTVKEKHTNARLERAWNITKNGQTMITLKRDLQVMESILRAIKNKLITLSIEHKESR